MVYDTRSAKVMYTMHYHLLDLIQGAAIFHCWNSNRIYYSTNFCYCQQNHPLTFAKGCGIIVLRIKPELRGKLLTTPDINWDTLKYYWFLNTANTVQVFGGALLFMKSYAISSCGRSDSKA